MKTNARREIVLTRAFSEFLLTGLSICFFFMAGWSAHGAEPAASAETVRVGYWYLPGYHEETPSGDRSGYGYEYLQKIASHLGWSYEYIGYGKSWAELMEMLKMGEIDLLTSATKTPARQEQFDYSNNSIGMSYTILTVRAGDARFRPNDYANWNGMRVGMIQKSSRNAQFEAFAKEKGFRYETVLYPTYDLYEAALRDGSVDALLSPNLRETKGEWILERLNPDPIYIIVRKGDKARLDKINRALALLELNEPYLNAVLCQRYYVGDDTPTIFMTIEEHAFLDETRRDKTVFRALLCPDSPPFAFRQDGEIRGILRDAAELTIKRSGLDIRIVPCADRREYDELLRKKEFDIIFDARGDYSEAERNGLYIGDAYLTEPVSSFRRKLGPEGTGRKAAVRNSRLLPGLKALKVDVDDFLFFDNPAELIRAVHDGIADVGYLSTRTLDEALSRDSELHFATQPVFGLRREYSVGVRRDQRPELFSILNKAVRSISQDELGAIIAAHKPRFSMEHSIRGWIATNPLKTTGILFFVLLFISTLLGILALSLRRFFRHSQVLKKLPLSFFVLDRKERILFYNATNAPPETGKLSRISELKEPVRSVMSRLVVETFENGFSTANYEFLGQKRTAVTSLLPKTVFGCEAVVWISQDTGKLQNAVTSLEYASELTNSASFRVNFKTREISGSKQLPSVWPIQDGKAVARENVVLPEDLPDFTRVTERLLQRESKVGIWNYRSSAFGELRYYRMQASVDWSDPETPYLFGVMQDVTEITLNIMRLKESSDLWDIVINSLSIRFFAKDADDDFRYVLCNQSLADFIGKRKEEIIGKNDSELFQRPEDAEAFRRKDREIMNTSDGNEFEEEIVVGDGKVISCQTMKKPFIGLGGKHLLLGMSSDITPLKRLIRDQQVINSCLETLFREENVEVAVNELLRVICEHFKASRCYVLQFDIGSESCRAFAEYAISEKGMMFKKDKDFLISKNDVWFDFSRRTEATLWRDLNTPEALELFGEWSRSYVKKYEMRSLFVAPIFLRGKLWGDFGVIYEKHPCAEFNQRELDMLTATAHLLEIILERQEAHEQLLRALEQAQAAAKAKSVFVASMSHEIRTPLNSVIGFSELLRNGGVSPVEQKEYLDNIAYSANALLQLINDVLDLSKLEADQMQLALTGVDFGELGNSVMKVFSFRAAEQHLELKVEIPPMPELELDKQRVRQILFNLIGNAVKFTASGSITLRARFKIQEQPFGSLIFDVIDTGCGIAKADQARLMKPFVQLANTHTNVTGTGLGLSISKRLAEKMGGTLWLESEVGKGSTFGVTLERVKSVQKNAPALMAGMETDGGAAPKNNGAKGISILLVDDVELNLKVLRAMCARAGVKDIVAVTSGRAALDELRKRPFDVLLTDMWMPEMTGEQLAKKIRSDSRFDSMRIFTITADIEAVKNFDMTHFSGILSKPITLERIHEFLTQAKPPETTLL